MKLIKGFTLIELLVVIAIIGVLSTLLVANFGAARERARDAQRKADLRNLQTALRLYYNDYGHYPVGTGTIEGCDDGTISCDWGGSWTTTSQTYMSVMPEDPNPTEDYDYQSAGTTDYTLTACLENTSDERCGATCTSGSGCEYKVSP